MAIKSRIRVKLIIVGAPLLLAVAAILITVIVSDPLRTKSRRAWKDQAIARIDRRIHDDAWLASEIARVKQCATKRPMQGGWVCDELLVFRNGDWIICRDVNAKEENSPVEKDLFIGYGSDGRWYYSTFHFCVGMCVLQMERQPDSLATFVDGYWLKPFDGKSDESLNLTWDGGAYGDEKRLSGTSR